MSTSTSATCWIQAYRQALECRPIMTKSATSAVLSALASVVAQHKHPFLNWSEIRNEAAIGCFLRGALVHFWHRLLNRITSAIIGTKWKPNSFSAALLMMFIDQTVFAPSLTFLYLVITGFLNQRSVSQIKAYLKKNYLQILQTNYRIWPIATLINFSFIPEQYRVAFSNLISFAWTIYLITKTQANLAMSPSERNRLHFKERFD